MKKNTAPLVVHLDGYFDNPEGDFTVEKEILETAGASFFAVPEANQEEIWRQAANADVVLFRAAALHADALGKLKRCRAIIRYGIGLDKVDIAAATKLEMAVCNMPDFCTQEMADHTMALALTLARKLFIYKNIAAQNEWTLTNRHPLTAFQDLTFATFGFGRIARDVLHRAKAFGFRLVATDPYVDPAQMAAQGVTSLSPEEILRQADILSLHCPLTESSRNLIGEEALQTMKPTAIVINTARGGLIHTASLVKALEGKELGGAGLDVTDPEPLPGNHPLYRMENVMITPHVAWYSGQAETRLRAGVAQEALRAVRGEPLRYQVNTR